jgi:bifunctional non-homologous end joining protein LigD
VPEKRAERIFIDYLRNGRGTTAIGTLSPRARAGFPVAAPVSWRQVEKGIRPDAFTMERPPRR